MPKLAKVLDLVFVPGAHPRSMRDWARAGVKAALPLLPDDEFDEIVSLRFDGGEDDTDDDEMDLSGAGAVAAQNSSLLREALDEDDFKAIEKDKEKRKNVYLKTKVREHQQAVASGRAKAKALAKARAKALGVVDVVPDRVRVHGGGIPIAEDMTVASFARYFPPSPTCRLALETRWHSRWRTRYCAGDLP